MHMTKQAAYSEIRSLTDQVASMVIWDQQGLNNQPCVLCCTAGGC